ncbi:hypothetical protein H5410_005259 [Solanum commersonii]|uniref:Uncharacterized protein n=1 Tax=Solanum commersonii TaxID=4109 RepID=A0A9J6A671_SOLCO|nr:hypothetical protein H5410_005259 [Solanum commersonii]
MQKFCPRQLRVWSASRRRGILLPRLIPFEAKDSVNERIADRVILSSSRRSGKEIATSGQKKRPRSGNVPLAPPAPKGQTRQFGLKAVSKEGKAWYKKHTEEAYFSDVCIDRYSLAREFP